MQKLMQPGVQQLRGHAHLPARLSSHASACGQYRLLKPHLHDAKSVQIHSRQCTKHYASAASIHLGSTDHGKLWYQHCGCDADDVTANYCSLLCE
jgi:Pyruvate/2-oxoacid:ferredoxin oxidoreductase delta subunit